MTIGLDTSEICRELGFQLRLGLSEKMVQQDVLGGDGCVRLQVEYPVALVMLARAQRVCGFGDLGVQTCIKHRGIDLTAACALIHASGRRAFH